MKVHPEAATLLTLQFGEELGHLPRRTGGMTFEALHEEVKGVIALWQALPPRPSRSSNWRLAMNLSNSAYPRDSGGRISR